MRLALIGFGRMNRAIAELAGSRGHTVGTVITGAENRGGAALTAQRLQGTDVAIEFTRPDQAADNLLRLASLAIPTVSGTTGWMDRLPEVARMVTAHGAALLHSPNFSIGVQLFLQCAEDLARRFRGRDGFEAFVVETHHAAKRDAPSGTALRLESALRAADPTRSFPVSSVRGGHVPGTHEVTYDSPYESIRLQHVARGRQAFAAGAVAAAEWIRGRQGVFTFDQMLFGEEP
ncbi:MAG TPA: dihydrodipicolinate reductase C-terminal domain-containing protein [Gemmatimonadales bacterium]|nr:dihydrodipicolinate reductase C-terminal domain-containing protein [Gemmatimonadales bacterium]